MSGADTIPGPGPRKALTTDVAEDEGFEAFIAGKMLHDNRYPRMSAEYFRWQDGWISARGYIGK